jgi:RNA polymerase sigma-70 factor (ECF subfamily)
MSRDEERTLLLRCRGGESAAFAPLVRAYESRIQRFLYALVGDHEEARDLTQDAFVRAWRKLDRYDPERPFLPWLTTIARRLGVELLRTRRRRRRWVVSNPPASDPDRPLLETVDPHLPDRDVMSRELNDRLQHALDGLSPALRETVVLKDVLDLSYDEVAALQAIPRGTVASRVYHARRALVEVLREGPDGATAGTDDRRTVRAGSPRPAPAG